MSTNFTTWAGKSKNKEREATRQIFICQSHHRTLPAKPTSALAHFTPLHSTGGPLKKTSKQQSLSDPHADREAQKYDQPIASRELILEVMAKHDVPIRFKELASALGINDDDGLFALQKRVKAMQRAGQLIAGRRGALGLPKKMDLVKCKIIGHRDGYGFASPVEEGDDFFSFKSSNVPRLRW